MGRRKSVKELVDVFDVSQSVVAEMSEMFCFSLYLTFTQPLQRLAWPGSSFG